LSDVVAELLAAAELVVLIQETGEDAQRPLITEPVGCGRAVLF